MEKQKVKRNSGMFKKGVKPANGFKKGQSGHPQGRPRGTKERDLMMLAKAAVEDDRKISIYQLAFEMAFDGDTKMMTTMLKKLVPDMAYIESDAAQTLADICALVLGGKGKE